MERAPTVLIKTTSLWTSIVQGAPCTAIREVSLLKDLKHANIGEISFKAWVVITPGGALGSVFNHLLLNGPAPPTKGCRTSM